MAVPVALATFTRSQAESAKTGPMNERNRRELVDWTGSIVILEAREMGPRMDGGRRYRREHSGCSL